MPANTVYVGRPTKWGNPYRVGDGLCDSNAEAINYYELWLMEGTDYVSEEPHPPPGDDEIKRELRSKDLACWCKPGDRCVPFVPFVPLVAFVRI